MATYPSDKAAIRASFAEIQMVKSRAVMVLKFEVPLEEADQALRALGGVPIPGDERWCGIARLMLTPANDQPKSVDRSLAAKVQYANKSDGEQAVIRSAILAKDERFQGWLESSGNTLQRSEETAAEYIRDYCTVKSRCEIAENQNALQAFKRLEDAYFLWRDGYEDMM